MSNTYYLNTDELRGMQEKLNAGDRVILSGTIYTARDAAHKRIFGLLDEGKPLPFALEDAIIYYAGPTPAQQGMAVGACGPTTASRMNAFAPACWIWDWAPSSAKGEMSAEVAEALIRNKACFFRRCGRCGSADRQVHSEGGGHRL